MTRCLTQSAAGVLTLWLVVSGPSAAFAGGGWVVYWDGSYHGQVLDAETKAPLEGVVIVAVYNKSCYRFIQTNSKAIGVQEVLTDTTGKFRIPSFWTISTPDCWYDYTDFQVTIGWKTNSGYYLATSRTRPLVLGHGEEGANEKIALDGCCSRIRRYGSHPSEGAFEVDTHKLINEQATVRSIDGFSLNAYLKNQLVFSQGFDQTIDNKSVLQWIIDGGKFEDNGLRYLHHFHDPLKPWDAAGFKGLFSSSILWGQTPVGTGDCFGVESLCARRSLGKGEAM
ncbi:MAG: hypothetical protein AB1451_15370 [Nitrospirota bacterium]